MDEDESVCTRLSPGLMRNGTQKMPIAFHDPASDVQHLPATFSCADGAGQRRVRAKKRGE